MDYVKLVAAICLGVALSTAYHRGSLPSAMISTLMTRSDAQGMTMPFRNCAAARAAGAAPVFRGQPGYAPWLDRDNDGIGCEPYAR